MLYYYLRDFLNDYHDYICEAIIWCFILFSVGLVFRLPRLFVQSVCKSHVVENEKRKLEDDV